MPRHVRLEEMAEGGLINDRSGKATRRIRAQVKVRSRPKGNPTLKRFK